MPATVVQDWTSTTTGVATPASTSIVLGQTATLGKTLLVAVNSDATVATPSGYSALVSSIHNAGCYLFGKIADGTETGVTVTPSVSASTSLAIAEIGGLDGALITDQLDQTASGGSASAAFTWATGTTADTEQADEYAVAVWGYSASVSQGADFTNGGGDKWINQTNSFVEKLDVATTKASGTNVGLCIAVRDLSATGPVESTATEINNQATPCETWIATFKVTATAQSVGAGMRPVRMVARSRMRWPA